jgi:sigma-B regulation protein RsbU (phosphoserine phosphatase)
VTGHGVGSAMVTAAVASSYRTLLQNKNFDNPGELLIALNVSFRALCGEAYRMTLSAIEIDSDKARLRWWSAGAPPILLLRTSGQADVLSVKGTPLGVAVFEAGLAEAPFNAGDRMLVFSDGVTESQMAKGGQFGIRRLRDFFVANQKTGLKELSEQLLKTLDNTRGSGLAQDDDITFVALEQKRYVAPLKLVPTASASATTSASALKAVTPPSKPQVPAVTKPSATMTPPPPTIPGPKKT